MKKRTKQIIATSVVLAAAAVLAVAATTTQVSESMPRLVPLAQYPTSLVFFENDDTGLCVGARSEDVRAALEDAANDGALLVYVGGGTYLKKDQIVAVARLDDRDCD